MIIAVMVLVIVAALAFNATIFILKRKYSNPHGGRIPLIDFPSRIRDNTATRRSVSLDLTHDAVHLKKLRAMSSSHAINT